jgi:pyridoxamine 5'-phosphate oxidase
VEAHFQALPRLRQMAIWASRQSEIIESYEDLRRHHEIIEQRFSGVAIPCPEYWGGYRILADYFEFCFMEEGHLDYRYVYERSGEHWLRTMKSP